MATIIKLGGITYVAGLDWKDADPKTIKDDAQTQAATLGESSDEASAGYVLRKAGDRQNGGQNGVYGVCLIPDTVATKKGEKLHSLAANVCDGLDDGLYVGLLSPEGVAQSHQANSMYWLLGVHAGVILPQTDKVFADTSDLQGNLAMLRAIMPGLQLFVDSRIEDYFLSGQQSWGWQDVSLSKKAKPIQFVTGVRSKGVLSTTLGPWLKAGALAVFLAGAGFGGWTYYQQHLLTQAPDPQEIAAQQRAAYEAHLQQMVARFHPTVLDSRWRSISTALEASRVIGSGYRLREFECGNDACRVVFASQAGFVSVPQAVVDALSRSVGPVNVQEQTEQGISLTWTLQAAQVQTLDAREWINSLSPRADAMRGLDALQRATFAAISPMAQLVRAPDGQGAQPWAALDQTPTPPEGEVGAEVITFAVQVPAIALASLPRDISRAVGGQPFGLFVSFDEDGLILQARAQVVLAMRN